MPIPNGFLNKSELLKSEERYPLAVYVCEHCSLVQLTHVVPSEIMFKNYLYIPSTSKTMLEHFKLMANEIINENKLSDKDLVVDIGSNDGALLSYFKEQEIKILGVDPAENLVKVANLNGISSIAEYFNLVTAQKIVKDYQKAKIITATNVVAHVDDLHVFFDGVNYLLDDKGVFIAEFPYLVDLLSKNEFDTIYHEHLSYFSLKPLMYLLNKHGMYIHDVRKQSIHGGSIRVYVKKRLGKIEPRSIVKELLQEEELKKLNTKIPYLDFARRVKTIKRDLVAFLKKLKKQNKTIIGYGASAKGNVLLNYCELTTSLIDFIVDSIPYKQGKFTPGTQIPIYPETRLLKTMPDYALVLSWNFLDEILNKQQKYREKGGQFIITIPYLRLE